MEKLKRKIEGDLKLTQETVAELERVKTELNQSVQRKEKEYVAMAAKIEDEATLGGKYAKQIKELQTRLEELDEELAIERAARSKAEKSRSILKKDLEDVKAATAKVTEDKKHFADEQAFLLTYVKQAEANTKYYYDLLEKIAAAEKAAADAAAAAAAAAKKSS